MKDKKLNCVLADNLVEHDAKLSRFLLHKLFIVFLATKGLSIVLRLPQKGKVFLYWRFKGFPLDVWFSSIKMHSLKTRLFTSVHCQEPG